MLSASCSLTCILIVFVFLLGHTFFIAQIEDLTTNPNLVVSNEQIQDIILFLCRSEGLSKHVDSFTKILLLIPHNQSSFFVQAPILTDDISSMNSLRYIPLISLEEFILKYDIFLLFFLCV